MIPAAYIPAARESLKDLRTTLVGEGLSELRSRTVIYDWLVRTADRVLPGDGAEAKRFVDAALVELSGTPTPPVVITPGPDAPPPVRTPVHATTFLRNGAKVSSHVLMSPKLSDADRAELIAYNKAQGFGVFYLYLANEGDYGRRSVSWSDGDRGIWKAWLSEIVSSGARPIIWMCADDSPGLAKRSDMEWARLVDAFSAAHGNLVSEWVTGLECDERWDAKRTQGLTTMLKNATGKLVGVHTTGLSSTGHAKGADKFYLQCGFGKSADQVADLVKQARARFGGPVICAEYHKSGETAEARAIGDAAIRAGAVGVGNGCSADGLRLLAKDTSVGGGTTTTTTGADAIDISAAKLLSKHRRHNVGALPIAHILNGATTGKSSMKYDGTPSDWKKTNGIDARCYIFWREGAQTFGGHFEWHEPGHDSRELKNIFGGYLDGKKPPSGAEVFYCLADNGDMNGSPTKRTNVVAGGRFP